MLKRIFAYFILLLFVEQSVLFAAPPTGTGARGLLTHAGGRALRGDEERALVVRSIGSLAAVVQKDALLHQIPEDVKQLIATDTSENGVALRALLEGLSHPHGTSRSKKVASALVAVVVGGVAAYCAGTLFNNSPFIQYYYDIEESWQANLNTGGAVVIYLIPTILNLYRKLSETNFSVPLDVITSPCRPQSKYYALSHQDRGHALVHDLTENPALRASVRPNKVRTGVIIVAKLGMLAFACFSAYKGLVLLEDATVYFAELTGGTTSWTWERLYGVAPFFLAAALPEAYEPLSRITNRVMDSRVIQYGPSQEMRAKYPRLSAAINFVSRTPMEMRELRVGMEESFANTIRWVRQEKLEDVLTFAFALKTLADRHTPEAHLQRLLIALSLGDLAQYKAIPRPTADKVWTGIGAGLGLLGAVGTTVGFYNVFSSFTPGVQIFLTTVMGAVSAVQGPVNVGRAFALLYRRFMNKDPNLWEERPNYHQMRLPVSRALMSTVSASLSIYGSLPYLYLQSDQFGAWQAAGLLPHHLIGLFGTIYATSLLTYGLIANDMRQGSWQALVSAISDIERCGHRGDLDGKLRDALVKHLVTMSKGVTAAPDVVVSGIDSMRKAPWATIAPSIGAVPRMLKKATEPQAYQTLPASALAEAAVAAEKESAPASTLADELLGDEDAYDDDDDTTHDALGTLLGRSNVGRIERGMINATAGAIHVAHRVSLVVVPEKVRKIFGKVPTSWMSTASEKVRNGLMKWRFRLRQDARVSVPPVSDSAAAEEDTYLLGGRERDSIAMKPRKSPSPPGDSPPKGSPDNRSDSSGLTEPLLTGSSPDS